MEVTIIQDRGEIIIMNTLFFMIIFIFCVFEFQFFTELQYVWGLLEITSILIFLNMQLLDTYMYFKNKYANILTSMLLKIIPIITFSMSIYQTIKIGLCSSINIGFQICMLIFLTIAAIAIGGLFSTVYELKFNKYLSVNSQFPGFLSSFSGILAQNFFIIAVMSTFQSIKQIYIKDIGLIFSLFFSIYFFSLVGCKNKKSNKFYFCLSIVSLLISTIILTIKYIM